ncbi:MAG: cbb3-type cytochrome c oxidase subunit I [Verrucomicrobia bacterium]|nr:cbb3-type cytochrome c oxidase subunit I [Verrucomicrobiota bacterium]
MPRLQNNTASSKQITTTAPIVSLPDPDEAAVRSVDWSLSRRAFSLAVGSLILAGCFALMLVVGRIPVISEWLGDPEFFKRCLVVHVDLSLVVWFFGFAAALYSLLPGTKRNHSIFHAGFSVALTGTVAMVAAMFVPGAPAILSNYVPMLDHWLFIAGIVMLFSGLLICFMDGRLFSNDSEAEVTEIETAPGRLQWFRITPDIAAGFKTAALAYVVAMTTFAISWFVTPRSLEARAYYELVFWGGGHVLQVANVAAMLAVWLLLLSSLLRRQLLSKRTAWLLFGALLLPHLVAPLLTLQGTNTTLYRTGSTRLMQFGIFPIVTIFLVICIRRIHAAFKAKQIGAEAFRDPRFIGFAASVGLTVIGFLLGAMIRGSSTLIPAHYHASIGAVTVSFMAVTYVLLKPLGFSLPGFRLSRLAPAQLYLFGIGQLVFALGFGWGGLFGLGRKAYGAEQHIRSVGEYIGVGVMAFGGLLAISGGLLFLFLVAWAGRPRISTTFSLFKMKYLTRSNA